MVGKNVLLFSRRKVLGSVSGVFAFWKEKPGVMFFRCFSKEEGLKHAKTGIKEHCWKKPVDYGLLEQSYFGKSLVHILFQENKRAKHKSKLGVILKHTQFSASPCWGSGEVGPSEEKASNKTINVL